VSRYRVHAGVRRLLLAFIPVDGNYWTSLLPGFVLLGIGAGAVFGPSTVAATDGIPRSQAGLASGLMNTAQQLGGSLGLAILTGVSTSAATSFAAGTGRTVRRQHSPPRLTDTGRRSASPPPS
jgi:MFS family permease